MGQDVILRPIVNRPAAAACALLAIQSKPYLGPERLQAVCTLTLDTVLRASPDQVSCDLEGEAAILNAKTGVYYGLDPVGTSIWNLIRQPKRLADVRDSIVREYEVDAAQCGRDLLELVEQFNAAGLVQVCDEVSD